MQKKLKLTFFLFSLFQFAFGDSLLNNDSSGSGTWSLIYLPVIIGVIAGVLSSGFVELLRFWYIKFFCPWLVKINYDEVDLTGVWEEKYIPLDPNEEKQIQNIRLEFTQEAHKLNGTGIFTTNNQIKKEYRTRKMFIKGNVRNRYVSIFLELDNSKRFGIVNYLLEVTPEGDEMKGFTNWYDPLIGDLNTASCVLVRQRNE